MKHQIMFYHACTSEDTLFNHHNQLSWSAGIDSYKDMLLNEYFISHTVKVNIFAWG